MLMLPAELTHAQAPACERMLRQAMRASAGGVIVDASALQVFDSSALAVLLACRREALADERGFAVLGLPARLRSLAGVYGIDTLLPEPA
jgi:phospholipid transport system transporter-binding protein